MAASDQVVDISEDATAVRRRRRRAFLRIGIPILGIILVIAAILGIAIYSHYANRQGVLALSDNLLDTLDAQIAQRVSAYLDPCARSLRIMRDIAEKTPPTDRRAVAENYAIGVLGELPQIEAFYVGDDAGNFLMVHRREGGGVSTKQVINEAQAHHVFLVDRDADGEEIARREDPTDTFDPRTRPWYHGALTTGDVFWTGIYIFFSDRKPGITVSTRVDVAVKVDRVLGVDIALDELSRFLGTLAIGHKGRALIIDGNGRLIAAPGPIKMVKQAGDEVVPLRLDEVDDPVLTAAYDRFRVEGQGRRTVEQGGVRYISSTTMLPGAGRDWWVLIVVPEDDFIGFVASNNRTALAMSLVIVAAVIILAVLLVRQGLLADRSARVMTERSRSIAQQSAAYAGISEQLASSSGEIPPAATESLTALTGASRASIWHLTMRGQVLRCADSYERDGQGHAGGFELHRRELPNFFEFLHGDDELTVTDAAADRRSAQFYNVIMHSLGSRGLTAIPLRHGDQAAGVICLEDAKTLEGTRDFLRTIAGMLSPTLQAPEPTAEPSAEAAQPSPGRPPVVDKDAGARILSADLGPSLADRAALGAIYYPAIGAMVLRLSGTITLARKAADDDPGAAARIGELLQQAAAEHEVPYLKFVGQQAIAAAGLDEDDDGAVTRVAAFAVGVRERLTHLFDTIGHDAGFKIGLGFGSCLGCDIGRDPPQFNLWGDAIQTAEIMAASSASGAIQASEAAYVQLHHDFLFRPRGSFYVPGAGESRTFVLAGQL
jgi:hypothetical protein